MKAPAVSKGNQDEQGHTCKNPQRRNIRLVRDGIEVALLDGNDDLEVVGESYYQENLWRLVGPRWPDERVRHHVYAVLIAEDDNPYDANAVAVWVQGLKVGHLSRLMPAVIVRACSVCSVVMASLSP